MRWIVCSVDVNEHDEFVAWCRERGAIPEWDHNSAWPAVAWVWLGEADRIFAKLRWG